MTDDQTPTARPEGLAMDERALLLDARSHRRTGAGCSSCIDGIELLAARTADLRGEVARWRERWQGTVADASNVMAERDRLAAQVERVRVLVDEWDGTVYKLPPGYPMTINQFSAHWFKQPLRAALDPAGPRQTDDGGDLRGLEGVGDSPIRFVIPAAATDDIEMPPQFWTVPDTSDDGFYAAEAEAAYCERDRLAARVERVRALVREREKSSDPGEMFDGRPFPTNITTVDILAALEEEG